MAPRTSTATANKRLLADLQAWTGSLDPSDKPLFDAFVRHVIDRVRGFYLAHYSTSHILTRLETAFEATKRRPAKRVHVEVRRERTRSVTVLIQMNDQPFIVDTTRLFLKNHAVEYLDGFNVILRLRRDTAGNLIGAGEPDGQHEALALLEADAGPQFRPKEAATSLRKNLRYAQAIVADFKPMTQRVSDLATQYETASAPTDADKDRLAETAAFLRWLVSENFVFMAVHTHDQSLGMTGDRGTGFDQLALDWPHPHFYGTVRVRKSPDESPVHREGRIDEVLISLGDQPQMLIRGMFTYRAVTQLSRRVPILRRVLADILAEQPTGPSSYRYKGVGNVFDSLPTEFLLTTTKKAIVEMIDLVLNAESRQEAGVTFQVTGEDRAFALVAMPKTEFSAELQRDIGKKIVRLFEARHCDASTLVGRYDTVLLYFYLTGIAHPGGSEVAALTHELRDLATPWRTRLWSELRGTHGDERAEELIDNFGTAFPAEWTRTNTAERTVRDVDILCTVDERNPLRADLFANGDELLLRVYQWCDVYLTDLLPLLSNFGLQIRHSRATRVTCRAQTYGVETFVLEPSEAHPRERFIEVAVPLTRAIEKVAQNAMSDDALNELVLQTGFGWQDVDVFRAYLRYSRQLDINITNMRMGEILLARPAAAIAIRDMFHTRFCPDVDEREASYARAREHVRDVLRGITVHDEHLTFSVLSQLIHATVRTNRYRQADAHPFLSFKIACQTLPVLGANRPLYEIFVHARDVEGVHLRFGTVARGGLRWSDRDDYRTEVQGLATTQQVKNVVIVPTGSKGGFFLKHASADRSIRREQADDLYRTFIQGMIDITDNRVGRKIITPQGVVRHDNPDPYLVVAADKGTAHLSDTANDVAIRSGFWLGDAFASGGSNGYDHKKVGITARGAWVHVRRHFLEMGHDPDKQDFACVAIGDMGGDVFGNGMLETPHVRLVAAFNHLHIFIDPNPDAQKSYKERKRLFGIQGGWDQYDPSLLSKGGCVVERRQRHVSLSPQAADLLGLDGIEITPEEVIRAILKLNVDLLWNGGIGTYVKSSTESHTEADDRSNTAIRIDAPELGARIVGEGGNLGLTQTARVEAALLGTRLNTDAIDNSAGVDMSDHEVNLKILLNEAIKSKGLTEKKRNALLSKMTDEVADLVLANNDAQGRQLAYDVVRSKNNIFRFGRAIDFIERHFKRDRTSLNLPDEATLAKRAATGAGLTRPELATLAAWVKMWVSTELAKRSAKSLPEHQRFLVSYFPKAIQREYGDLISQHMLCDEIAMMSATTQVIADAGASFFPWAAETTGASVVEIATAYLKAQSLAGVDKHRPALEPLSAPGDLLARYDAWVALDAGIGDVANLWLSARGQVPDDNTLNEMRKSITSLYRLQATDTRADIQATAHRISEQGISARTATAVARAAYLNILLSIWTEAKRANAPIRTVAVRYFAIGRATGLQAVIDELASRPPTARWDPTALRILHNRFRALLRRLVSKSTLDVPDATVDRATLRLAEGPLSALRAHVDDLIGEDRHPSVATLLVLEERVASMVRRL